jgi:hypothetical protein
MQLCLLDVVEKITTIVGGIIAAGALVFTAVQTFQNTKSNRALFWLELRKMFAEHNDVHVKLRPNGAWH